MYNYNFKENQEKVVKEIPECYVESNNEVKKICLLITNKNILFFHNMNEGNVLNSRGMYMPPEYILIYKIPISGINYKSSSDKTIINYLHKEIIIYDFDLKTVL